MFTNCTLKQLLIWNQFYGLWSEDYDWSRNVLNHSTRRVRIQRHHTRSTPKTDHHCPHRHDAQISEQRVVRPKLELNRSPRSSVQDGAFAAHLFDFYRLFNDFTDWITYLSVDEDVVVVVDRKRKEFSVWIFPVRRRNGQISHFRCRDLAISVADISDEAIILARLAPKSGDESYLHKQSICHLEVVPVLYDRIGWPFLLPINGERWLRN